MSRKLFIHAVNVHQGGGYILLMAILAALPEGVESLVSLDARASIPEEILKNVLVRRIKPTIFHRLQAERWLLETVQAGDIVLCLGNLPPFFKLPARVLVLLQNRYLVDAVGLREFPLKTGLRIGIERFWLRRKLGNVDEFLVQTPSMQILLQAMSSGAVPIRIAPFVSQSDGYGRKISRAGLAGKKAADFLYIASGEPHKNHRRLVEAWCLLADGGLYPSLLLTVDATKYEKLVAWIQEKTRLHDLNIECVPNVPHVQIASLFDRSAALIYPSTLESFGLPLIEARQAGLAILASELDYVRDVVDPEQTFDAASALSIARAVKRFLDVEEHSLPLQDSAAFLAHILKEPELQGANL